MSDQQPRPSAPGRVHWAGASTVGGAAHGPRVTARGPAAATPSISLSLSPSVRRANHPGNLNLAERLPATDALSLTGAKGLDEQGLDNRAFLELQRELQRHEAYGDDVDEEAEAHVSSPIDPQPAVTLPVPRPRRVRPQSTDVSGTVTPGSATTDSSYDPANDSDLDHIDFMPGETDGMPDRLPKSEQKPEPTSRWAKIRGMLANDLEKAAAEPVPQEKAAPLSPSTGGPTNRKSVPVETSSGIHTRRRRPSKFERRAARLVQQHKLTNAQMEHEPESAQHLSGTTSPDALDMDARPVHSGGVLGNLLRLYEAEQQQQRRGRDDSDHADTMSHSSLPLLRGANKTTPHISQTFAKVGNAAVSTSTKVVRNVATETGIDSALDERPKAARSAAGVFGALIATTGNMVGAVSPHHAQLGPNPKRPGYSLDRYLLPEMNAKTLKRTAQIVADAAPVPYRPGHSPIPSRSRASRIHSPLPHSPLPGSQPHSPRDQSATLTPAQASPPPEPHRRPTSMAGSRNMLRNWTHSALNTPDIKHGSGADYFGAEQSHSDYYKQEWQRKLKRRAKDKKRKEEVFITMHVAAILERQEFIMKLARALMMFGAPTHRIETQIQQTARVLDINCKCIYLPNLMLLAFGDDATHTSETKFIKQSSGLDLTKLTDMHTIYWNVIHDKIGVGQASRELDELMRRKPLIGRWPMVFIGGMASAFICVGPQGFSGSFIDALMAFPLGAFLVYCQSIITTELYSNVFEIVFATLNSFVAAAVQSSGYFCYSAVVSGSIVLILPGFIVLSGSLELQSKNLIAGSVRLVYAIIYSLFLGFGISIGVSFWQLFSGNTDAAAFNSCTYQHGSEWWRRDVGEKWALLTTPGYSVALSLRNQAKITRKEFPIMVIIACSGWACNHFAAKAHALSGRQDVTSALGSLAVGILANTYGRFFDGRSFVVSVTGILYQLPSGLSNGGGLLNFANNSDSSSAFASGFTVAQSLVEVALGLTVGLFASTVLSYSLGGKRMRNGGGLFSF